VQRLSFETIGSLRPVLRPESSTGAGPGTTGSSVTAMPDEDVARGWLLAQPDPAAADKALLTSLQSSLGVEVTVETELRFPVSGGFRVQAVGARILPGSVEENIPAAAARMKAALTGPTKDQAEDWLVMLQSATAGGRKSEAGTAVALELYAGCLMRFPADVAKAACFQLAMTSTWFPTLAEINATCEAMSSNRRLLARALEIAA